MPPTAVDAANTEICFETLAGHRTYLMRIARLELRDEHLAEDCVSDVLTQAYERRATFRGDSALRTWLTSHIRSMDQGFALWCARNGIRPESSK